MNLPIRELTNTLQTVRFAVLPGAPTSTVTDGVLLTLCMCANRTGAPVPTPDPGTDQRRPGVPRPHFATLGR